nr:DUF547 domain-containing protein [Hyphomonas sp. Mor2]
MPYSHQSRRLLAAIAVTAFGFSVSPAALAEDPVLFQAYTAESALVVETAPYEEIIGALSVPENGRTLIAYDVAKAQALPFFSRYVDYLANVPVEALNRDEQLAYWLNTRNTLLIQALAEEGRVRGFKRKRGTPQDPGAFWTATRITVAGSPLSLQEIEENILFAGWDDPNIVFGLYQGLKGGPALPRKPFTGANVHAELAEAGRLFTSESRNFRVRGDKVRISSYFDWYLPLAYGGDERALRTHLATFARAEQQDLVRDSGALDRRNLSTDFEQYRTRQAGPGLSSGSGGTRPAGGYGS